MVFLKRIFLFAAVNILVVVTISLILNLLGIQPYLTDRGIRYESLMAFCLVWGMGGAFISLLLSKVMAKWMMGVKIIPANTHDSKLQELVQMVHQFSRAAHLPTYPDVGIYDSPEVNAFATGPTKRHSLVAVSTGLLDRMGRDEVAGVIGHEVAHIANGDMVTMTLIQGIVNAFVMFLSRVIAFAIAQVFRGDKEEREGGGMSYGLYWVVQIVLEIVFMILGTMVVAWFSRWREFRADAGGARLAGRNCMINALEGLRRTLDQVDPNAQPAIQSLKISSRPGGFLRFFSTHPPLEERIARLQSMI